MQIYYIFQVTFGMNNQFKGLPNTLVKVDPVNVTVAYFPTGATGWCLRSVQSQDSQMLIVQSRLALPIYKIGTT